MRIFNRITACFLTLVLQTNHLLSQSYFEDFEQASVGDNVFSVGIEGGFGFYSIEENGVGGSNGFEVAVSDQISTFDSGFLPVEFGIEKIGDQLSFQVDAQITLSDNGVPFDQRALFDLNIFGVNDGAANFLLGQIAVVEEGSFFATRIFTSGANIDNVNQLDQTVPLSEIGIENEGTGTSLFFKLQVDIHKLDVANYSFATSVLDLDGRVLSSQSVENLDIEAIFENFTFAAITTTKTNNFFDSVRFDNIRFEVVSTIIGDINLDGVVDLLDVAPFVDLLTNSGYQVEADINLDGVVDLLDVGPFVSLLTGA